MCGSDTGREGRVGYRNAQDTRMIKVFVFSIHRLYSANCHIGRNDIRILTAIHTDRQTKSEKVATGKIDESCHVYGLTYTVDMTVTLLVPGKALSAQVTHELILNTSQEDIW